MSREALRIGTRGSRLARWQAQHVAQRLADLPGFPGAEIVTIRTQGDEVIDRPLSEVQGKAFFTKEIEDALLDGRIDLAVHSLKDLATELPPGTALGAVLERADPRDALVSRRGEGLDQLDAGQRVGTSSLRRQAFLARRRPDLEIVELRGNVPTRLRRLERGELHAIVVAAAGLVRLGLADRIAERLEPAIWPPAVAQGAIGLQVRAGDTRTGTWVQAIDHGPTRAATTAERALLHGLEGGCQVPLGALARANGGTLELAARVCSLDGRFLESARLEGAIEAPEELGTTLAAQLRAKPGVAELLASCRARGGAR